MKFRLKKKHTCKYLHSKLEKKEREKKKDATTEYSNLLFFFIYSISISLYPYPPTLFYRLPFPPSLHPFKFTHTSLTNFPSQISLWQPPSHTSVLLHLKTSDYPLIITLYINILSLTPPFSCNYLTYPSLLFLITIVFIAR